MWEEGRYALTSGGAPGDATLRGKREGVRTITHPKEKPQLNVSPEQRKDPSLPILDRSQTETFSEGHSRMPLFKNFKCYLFLRVEVVLHVWSEAH